MSNPIKDRKFTDVICALIFILYSIFSVYIFIHGWAKGDLKNLAQPYDADGKACGRGDYSEHDFLYINNPASTSVKEEAICIASCPRKTSD